MKKSYLKGLLILAVVFFIGMIPLPYVLYSPGEAISVDQFIQVDGEDSNQGSYRVMTVFMQEARVYNYLTRYLPYHELYPKKQVYGEQSSDQYYKVQEMYMENANQAATKVAYQAAGKSINEAFLGIYVMSIDGASAFSDQLQVGDLITQLNGKSFSSAQDFIQAVQEMKVGDQVTVTYQREDKEGQAQAKLIENPDTGKAMIGISLVSDMNLETDPSLSFDPNGVSGPSAGLMFTLSIYDKLTPGDLTQGAIIAGTGTMSEDGSVGEIGGVDQKVVAADKAGAKVFFAPLGSGAMDSNYQVALATAKKIQSDMVIYPVSNFTDALNYLKSMK